MSHEEIKVDIYDRKTVSELWFLRKYLICWQTSFFTVVISLNTDVLLCWLLLPAELRGTCDQGWKRCSHMTGWSLAHLPYKQITILWLDSWYDFKAPLPTYLEVFLLKWQQKTCQSRRTKICPLCWDHVNRVIQNDYSPNQQISADESLDKENNHMQWMQ